ncbi:MAG TPA: hypothetical protein VGU03_09980 [Frateuria sp.]|uniref:hypothetical protein n=1 Tax=Frateuria sp. TaxID=2211372 RepID=UPI002DEA8CB6|nr:hypothetical protein [Frateuria sp.]
MDQTAFLSSLAGSEPPPDLSVHLQALWWLGRGAPERAHHLVQVLEDTGAAAIHAHVHRLEGDEGNALYWYGRAGLPFCTEPIKAEWQALVGRFL